MKEKTKRGLTLGNATSAQI